jgi:hypothetical protein
MICYHGSPRCVSCIIATFHQETSVIDLTPNEVATGDQTSDLFERVLKLEEQRREAVCMAKNLELYTYEQAEQLKQLKEELQQQSQKVQQQSEQLQQQSARIVELEQDGHVKKRTKTTRGKQAIGRMDGVRERGHMKVLCSRRCTRHRHTRHRQFHYAAGNLVPYIWYLGQSPSLKLVFWDLYR